MDRLLTWLGTVLGALAALLALSTLPSTWASHHRAAYGLLMVAVVVCLLIAILVALWRVPGWLRFRWMVRRASKKPFPGSYVDKHAVPESATGKRDFSFVTVPPLPGTSEQSPRLVKTAARPAGLRVTKPFEASVWAGHLPVAVRHHGKTIFRVTQFVADGFVIEDQAPGITVEGDVSYSDIPDPAM
jgi:hypothetical protein